MRRRPKQKHGGSPARFVKGWRRCVARPARRPATVFLGRISVSCRRICRVWGDIVGRGGEVSRGGCDSLRRQNRAAVVCRKRGWCWRRWPLSVAHLPAPEVQEPAWSEREQHQPWVGLFPDSCRETEDKLARAVPKVRELVRESAWALSVPHAAVAKVAKHPKVSTGQMR